MCLTKETISAIYCCSTYTHYQKYAQNCPQWLLILLIILSNDIHPNPGPPFHNSFFNFMSWNVNSIAKDNFERVRLIEAHNSIYNYDLISAYETSLNDSVKLPDILLTDYTFVQCNNPTNTRHGGVGLFYKNSLPIKIRNDLSFDESIVVELHFGRKNFFFTVVYRSPAYNHTSPEFMNYRSPAYNHTSPECMNYRSPAYNHTSPEFMNFRSPAYNHTSPEFMNFRSPAYNHTSPEFMNYRSPAYNHTSSEFMNYRSPAYNHTSPEFMNYRSPAYNHTSPEFMNFRSPAYNHTSPEFMNFRSPAYNHTSPEFMNYRSPAYNHTSSEFMNYRSPAYNHTSPEFMNYRSPAYNHTSPEFMNFRSPAYNHTSPEFMNYRSPAYNHTSSEFMNYRSPAYNHTSPEFMNFLSNFNNLYAKIKNENPFASFFTGDFNGHSQFWWPDGDTTAEGRELENLISSLGLSQLNLLILIRTKTLPVSIFS